MLGYNQSPQGFVKLTVDAAAASTNPGELADYNAEILKVPDCLVLPGNLVLGALLKLNFMLFILG